MQKAGCEIMANANDMTAMIAENDGRKSHSCYF